MSGRVPSLFPMSVKDRVHSLVAGCKRTEDELLGRREHVQRGRDFVLVVLLLQPAGEVGGRVWLQQEVEGGGEDEEGEQEVGIERVHGAGVVGNGSGR